jgi:hypothetical protein
VTRRSAMRVAACLGVAAVVLSGCSEKQAASSTLPASSAPAETTSELPPLGPEDMPMPDEARTQDAAGAEAFVRYYIELINRTSKTLDTAPLREFSAGCDDCDRIAANADQSARAGYRYDGGEIRVTEVAPPLVKGGTGDMAIRVDQSTLVVRDPSGNRVDEASSDAFIGVPASTAMSWDPARECWVMTYMAFG